MNPSKNVEYLNDEYDLIEHMINRYDNYSDLKALLTSIKDMEFLQRKIVLKNISPANFISLCADIKIIKDLFIKIQGDEQLYQYVLKHNNKVNCEKFIDYCDVIISMIEKTLNKDIAIKENGVSYETNFINTGISSRLDEKYTAHIEANDKLLGLRTFFDSIVKKNHFISCSHK